MALRPLDPSIVNFYQPPKLNLPDPLQDLASIEQIKSGRVSREVNEQQLAQLKRDNLALDEMRKVLVSQGQSPDLDVAADAMIATGIPNVMDVGYKLREKQKFQKNFLAAMGGGQPAPAQPAPVATTAPIQGPVMSVENLSGGNAGIKMRPILPEQAPAPATTNALGLPTNFGENTMAQLRQLERQRDGLSMLAAENPQITPMVAELSRQIAELRKPQIFSRGQTVAFPGQEPFTLPEKAQDQPSLVQEYNFAKTQEGGGFKGSYQDFVVARSAAMRTPAQPLAPVATFDTTLGKNIYATREEILKNPTRFLPPSEKPEQIKAGELRDEFNALTKDFRAVQDAHTKITTTAPTGAGDMSLLYNYVKLLDPTSVVRESEFAAAAASGSFGERVQTAVNKVMTGQRLSTDLRRDFITEANNLYKAQKAGADRIKDQYTNMAKRAKLNPEDVIVDYAASPVLTGATSNIPQAAIDFLRQGRGTREQFDAQFGPGSAKRVLGN